MLLTMIESPFAGDQFRNVVYARACMRHSLSLGEAPFAGHLLYPQVLDDDEPADRRQGIYCHLTWLSRVDQVVVYEDLGISPGMREGIAKAEALGKPVIFRHLPEDRWPLGWDRDATLGLK